MTGLKHRAEIRQSQLEAAEREVSREKRVRQVRADALKDKRRYRTRLAFFRAYVEMARDPTTESITVGRLCERCNIQEAAFHKRFPASADELRPMQRLLLATVEEIVHAALREVNLRMKAERVGDSLPDQLDRITITVAVLVRFMTHYPRLFNVEGVIPREVILALSDPLANAIIASMPLSRQEEADARRMAKYHAAALVGIMRSGLEEDAARNSCAGALAHEMVSQILPPLLIGYEDPQIYRCIELAEQIEPPPMHLVDGPAAKRLEAAVGRSFD